MHVENNFTFLMNISAPLINIVLRDHFGTNNFNFRDENNTPGFFNQGNAVVL